MTYTRYMMMKPRLMFPEPEDTGGGVAEGADDSVEITQNEVEEQQPNANPFEAAFNNEEPAEPEAESAETEESQDDYKLGLTEEEGFDADEIPMLTSLCKKHNLPADSASAFLKEVYAEADRRGKEASEKQFSEATKNLQDKWGGNFEQNARKAGTMIRALGGRLGWNEQRMKDMLNPHDVELMYEFSRYVGDNKMHGLSKQTQMAPKVLSKAEMEERLVNIMAEHYNARKAGDSEKMKALSDEHFELSKKLKGGNPRRMLLY